jgi:hypothetical protein
VNLPDKPAIRHAYEQAVVAILNATDCTEDEAEAFIDAMTDLIFTTMQTYIQEETNVSSHSN